MAQKVQVLLVDDLDGGEADETVTFALDGVTYEIDLTHGNADKLRELLSPYTDKGRRTGGRASRGKPAAKRTTVNSNTATIRAWAKSNGYQVNDRGRIPREVQSAFEAAQAKNAAPAAASAPQPAADPEPEQARDERVAKKAASAKRTTRKAAAGAGKKEEPAGV